MIAGYLGLPLSYPFVCETNSGAKIRLANREDLATAWIIFLRGEYRVEAKDQTIVDCGANIGVFSIYAACAATESHVFALEPYPSTFRDLVENITLNGLDKRVACISAAVTDSDGVVNMYAAPEVPSQARQVIRPSGPDTVPVPAMKLSTLLDKIGVGRIDLLKMDIEGSEHPALLAADPVVLRRVQRLCVEYHQTGSKSALFLHLQAAGFVLRRDRVLGHNYGVADFAQSQ